MRKFIIIVMMLTFCIPVFAEVDITEINFSNVNANTFDRSLRGWINTLNMDIVNAGVNLGTGKVFYVDSAAGGSSSSTGTTLATAAPTLDVGVNLCTANRGDIIYVVQGHNEALDAASDVDIDVAGVTVIGLGAGSLKPTFDYDAATADMFVIGADNVTVINLRLRVSANATPNAIDIPDGIDYASILSCDFGFAETSTDEFATAIQTNDASNYLTVKGCYFDSGAEAAVAAITMSKDTKGTNFSGNIVIGTYSTAPVLADTTASTNMLIDSNVFFTAGTADTFNLVAASTGIVSNNLVTMNAVSAAAALDIGNCLNLRNTIIADDDVGGTKAEPAVASAYASVTASADD